MIFVHAEPNITMVGYIQEFISRLNEEIMKLIRRKCLSRFLISFFFTACLAIYILNDKDKLQIFELNKNKAVSLIVRQNQKNGRIQQSSSQPGEKAKVLLVTYMRGGSSFVGELINRNADGCYWYEPMEAMYHAMYGFVKVLLPLDLNYFRNGTKRNYPVYEKQNIVEYTTDILNGRMVSLPLVQFYNRLIIDSKASWTQGYRRCLINHFRGRLNWMVKWRKRKCSHCKYIPTLPELDQCYKHAVKQDGSVDHVTDRHQVDPKCPQEADIKCMKQCMAAMYNHMKPCERFLNNAKEKCQSKKVVGIKAIRMPMSLVGDILKKDPGIKVIHYIRDPRGIVLSRRESSYLISAVSKKSWTREITLLCNKMQDDYIARKQLEIRFPNSILSIKYEQFAKEPLETGKLVYNHIGQPFPENLQDWLYKSTHESGKERKFGTFRKNSTKTAYRWKEKLPKEVIEKWTKPCKHVLHDLGYT